jgi:hypothetical protein
LYWSIGGYRRALKSSNGSEIFTAENCGHESKEEELYVAAKSKMEETHIPRQYASADSPSLQWRRMH